MRYRLKSADNVGVVAELVGYISVRVKADGDECAFIFKYLANFLQNIELSASNSVNLHTTVEEDKYAVGVGVGSDSI